VAFVGLSLVGLVRFGSELCEDLQNLGCHLKKFKTEKFFNTIRGLKLTGNVLFLLDMLS